MTRDDFKKTFDGLPSEYIIDRLMNYYEKRIDICIESAKEDYAWYDKSDLDNAIEILQEIKNY